MDNEGEFVVILFQRKLNFDKNDTGKESQDHSSDSPGLISDAYYSTLN